MPVRFLLISTIAFSIAHASWAAGPDCLQEARVYGSKNRMSYFSRECASLAHAQSAGTARLAQSKGIRVYGFEAYIVIEKDGTQVFIAGSETKLGKIAALWISEDATRLWVLDRDHSRALSFDLGLHGNLAPLRIIDDSAFGLAESFAGTSSGEIAVVLPGNSVLSFDRFGNRK